MVSRLLPLVLPFLMLLAIAVVALRPVAAQTGPNAAIEATIRSQLDAFLADDFATAFTFASPMIRDIFGTPERFGEMVRQGYPMVWRPAEVRYLELRPVAGELWQRVMIVDQAGALHMLDYRMIPDGDGWRINGVHILRAAQIGA
jgi:hypothetical protein